MVVIILGVIVLTDGYISGVSGSSGCFCCWCKWLGCDSRQVYIFCGLQVEMRYLLELKLILSNIKANCKQPKLIQAHRSAM